MISLNRLVLSQNGTGYTKINIYVCRSKRGDLFWISHNVAGMTSYANQLGKVSRYEYHAAFAFGRFGTAAGWENCSVAVAINDVCLKELHELNSRVEMKKRTNTDPISEGMH